MCAAIAATKRGRPPKFGRPSRLVALTLPEEVIRGLRKLHADLAWAVVMLFDKRHAKSIAQPQPDVELASIGDGKSLIVVSRAVFKRLPGIDIIPLAGDRAFLALESGRDISDLELAVFDRLETAGIRSSERRALLVFRRQLRALRRNRDYRSHTRAIIVVERGRALRKSRTT
jgi:hypothetical protein